MKLGRASWAGVTGDPSWVATVRRRARLDGALTVFVAADSEPAGALVLEDRIRPDSRRMIRAVRRGGIRRIVDLRGLLYGLYAVLRLHTVQEDETYLSLSGDAGALAAAGQPRQADPGR